METVDRLIIDGVPYDRLSDRGLWTLTHVALPVAANAATYQELSSRLGIPRARLAWSMRALRNELRHLAEDDAA